MSTDIPKPTLQSSLRDAVASDAARDPKTKRAMPTLAVAYTPAKANNPTPESVTCPDGVPVEHELGHLPDHCPTCAEGTPERVTLTDEEREVLHQQWLTFKDHRPVGAYLPLGQLDGDCGECSESWPCAPVATALATTRTARDQALRDEIAGEIEDARDDMLRVTKTDPRHPVARVYDDAARIARGGAR